MVVSPEEAEVPMSEADTHNGALVKKDGALAGAAVSAAVGLAVYGFRKAVARGSERLRLHEQDDGDLPSTGRSLLVTVWESASDALVPLAEDAAESAGRWAAKGSPSLVRDRLVPRFIESFKDAS
jgi:hypothetical protein